LQRAQRVFHALAFDQVQHQARLLRRDAGEIRFGSKFHKSCFFLAPSRFALRISSADSRPPNASSYDFGAGGAPAAGAAGAEGTMAPGPPGTPAGLAAASAAALTECPLNWRGEEESPRSCSPPLSLAVT